MLRGTTDSLYLRKYLFSLKSLLKIASKSVNIKFLKKKKKKSVNIIKLKFLKLQI